MEPHGGRTIAEGPSVADPVSEQSDSGGETGLEETVENLELGGPGGVEESYPERPGQADCLHYLRTGNCGYGSRCRFNHPHDRGKAIRYGRHNGAEFPERAGQPVCQYYMRTGSCKYGASCKYHHPRPGAASASPVSLNYHGYPIRPGEKECSYYMKTGQCKFGETCKFHHPMPVDMQVPAAPPHQPLVSHFPGAMHLPYPSMPSPSGPSSQDFGGVVRPTLYPGSYLGPYGHVLLPPDVSFPGFWGPYQVPVAPVAAPGVQPGVGPSSLPGVMQPSSSAVAYAGHYQPVQSSPAPSSSRQREHSFPLRPGQPICQYYMKTGDCKFGSSCRYHHPSELTSEITDPVIISPGGLPLRPGAPPCAHYRQHGMCRFGPSCKYDHSTGSMSYTPSASSLTDMPVATPTEGSMISTLTPSSSALDLQPKTVSGDSKEPVSTNMSSSKSTSSEAAGSIYSSSGSTPHSNVPKSDSGASHSSSTNSNNTSKETHTST